jgi:hypothetical protein
MNPFNYLHLPDRQADIRGHHIALYARYNKGRSSATLLVFDFIDGRWSKSAREPYHRLKEAIGQSEKLGLSEDIFYPHLVFFTSALRWWGGSLDSLNDQLIKYVRRHYFLDQNSIYRMYDRRDASKRINPQKLKLSCKKISARHCTLWLPIYIGIVQS